MVHLLAFTIIIDSECLTCSGFSLGETIRFRSFEFITDCFDGLSVTPGF
jgi:hypothetical protein